MAWQFPLSTSSSSVALNLSPGGGVSDSAFVADGVLIASTDSVAIQGLASGHEVVIAGTAASNEHGTVVVGSSGTIHHDNIIQVRAGGEISSFGDVAVQLVGYHSQLTNAGLIDGEDAAVYLWGVNANTVTTVVNSGTISSRGIGIAVSSFSSETVAFTNSGNLSAPTAYGIAGLDATVRDFIANTGRINGTILFGSGDDSYSGAKGHLAGQLMAGGGNDVATGGTDNDRFDGGIGNDTLNGGLGNDILKGDAGNDTLFGGAGKDTLTGGLNNDFFVFNTALNASTNRDVITDFNHVNDTFKLENAIFTKLGAGVHALNAGFFHNGAAADANDYIVYNKATGVLSYDNDGNGAHAAIAFAVLNNKPVLAANDFQVI
jgi:Ca2+-binding RTX toxin-like protein